MRWLILALSLGTTLATLYRGIALFVTNLGTAGTASSSPFWWAVALCVGALFGFIGGVLAFNHKAVSLIFLLAATAMTYFGYSANHVLVFSFAAISLLTLIYIAMHRRSRLNMEYDYDYERSEKEYTRGDDEDDEVDDEEDAEREVTINPGKKIPKRRSSYLTSHDSESLTIKNHPKQRETKVCLSCGMDIPISYKFCPSCGTALYVPAVDKLDATLEEAEEMKTEDDAVQIRGVEDNVKKHDTKRRQQNNVIEDEYDDNEDDIEINENSISGQSEDVEVVPVVRKTSFEEMEENQENQENDDIPYRSSVETTSSLHTHASKKQRKAETDSSYQSFGRYTQSRKRRKVSLFQRALLTLLVLCLVGSVSLFIYMGIGKTNPPEVDVPPLPVSTVEITDDIANVSDNIGASGDELLQLAVPRPSGSELPYMDVVPARQVITTGNGVNIRENHTTTNSKSITRVQANNTYVLLDQWKVDDVSSLSAADKNLTDTWFRIQVNDNVGWIYGQYVMPLDGRAASLPTGYTDALLNSFGSNKEEIEEKLGTAKQQNRGDTTILDYTNLSITLSQNKVQNIQITGRGHNLINGLAVGITFDEMTQIIGSPNRYRNNVLTYLEANNRGIAIRRENGRKIIRSISVGNI